MGGRLLGVGPVPHAEHDVRPPLPNPVLQHFDYYSFFSPPSPPPSPPNSCQVSKGIMGGALAKELYLVVALSMALTPFLAEFGQKMAKVLERTDMKVGIRWRGWGGRVQLLMRRRRGGGGGKGTGFAPELGGGRWVGGEGGGFEFVPVP